MYLPVINLDGVIFGYHHVFVALDSYSDTHKHALDVVEGASKNPVVVQGLLEGLVQRGTTQRHHLVFLIVS
jgi:hypothetical protein